MTTFVLVPGFWLGSWAWGEVADGLRSAGHEVHAVTPFGVGERANGPDVTVEDQVEDLVAALRERDAPVVLVGHSGGGPVVAPVAERVRERVAALVFVDTGPLPEGVTHLDFVGPERAAVVRRTLDETGGWYPMPPRSEHGAAAAGLDEGAFERIRARSAPLPGGVAGTWARRSGVADPTLPKTVVACTFSAADVRAAVAVGAPGMAEMDGPDWTVVELPTGHWPMFSEPAALTGVLAEAAAAER